MGLRIQILKKSDYLVADFSGAGDLDEVSQQFGLLAERCLAAKKSRLLIDTSAVQSVPAFTERFRAGERAVVFGYNGIKIAMVSTPGQVDPKLLGELVARNRGVNGRVFTDLAAAKRWLLEKPRT
ncbi:MAG: hypothetical protein ABSG01_13335 [Anaerolineales bacterium]